jgi:hypothetical protein
MRLTDFYSMMSKDKIASGTFWIVAFAYALAFLLVPTDNNGDPHDYMTVARTLFSGDQNHVSILRSFGYPLFVKITSINLHHLNLTFFVQTIILLCSIRYFSNCTTTSPILRALLYLPALIPSVIYLQTLLFPDGLILSFLLLYIGSLSSRPRTSLLIALLLIAIKNVFIFLIPLSLLRIVWGEYSKSPNWTLPIYTATIFFLVPLVFFVKPLPIYQTVVQVLDQDKNQSTSEPNIKKLEFFCAGSLNSINDPTILNKIQQHTADDSWMPIGSDAGTKLGCSASEIKDLQRSIIINTFLANPAQQIKKLFKNFYSSILNIPQVAHSAYMLGRKSDIFSENIQATEFYEKSQLSYFESFGLKPVEPPFYQAFRNIIKIQSSASKIYHATLLLTVILIFIFSFTHKRPTLTIAQASVLIFLISYSFCIAIFAFVYDRYIAINYFATLATTLMCLKSQLSPVAQNNHKQSLHPSSD